jgi:hypothetical protein
MSTRTASRAEAGTMTANGMTWPSRLVWVALFALLVYGGAIFFVIRGEAMGDATSSRPEATG